VAKPLEFAARDDFAHVGRVRDLDATVAAAAERALALAIPRDARKILEQIAKGFGERKGQAAGAAEIRGALESLRPLADPRWDEAALERSPASLPGIGSKRAEGLARRGVHTVADLLFHLPSRYDDRRSMRAIADLEVGSRATFTGRVLVSGYVARRGRRAARGGRSFEAVVGDGDATVRLKWFHASDAIASRVKKDALLLVTGEITRYRFDKQIVHPEIESLSDTEAEPGAESPLLNQIVPEYTAPEKFHPRALRRLIESAVAEYADLVGGHLPADIVRERDLPSAADALREIHRPDPDSDLAALCAGTSRAKTRLILEELYLLELGLALRRANRRLESAPPITPGGAGVEAAEASLPFELTAAQSRAWGEIAVDLSRPHPMSRLLEGDVGSGKTVVAYLAAVAVAGQGYQSALMAPTELLAEQHARTLTRLAEFSGRESGLRLALLTASRSRADAQAVRRDLAAGKLDLVVPEPGVGSDRRATPLRREAARGVGGQGPRRAEPPHTRHDCDSHSADTGAHATRRPRSFSHRRVAAGSRPDADAPPARGRGA